MNRNMKCQKISIAKQSQFGKRDQLEGEEEGSIAFLQRKLMEKEGVI